MEKEAMMRADRPERDKDGRRAKKQKPSKNLTVCANYEEGVSGLKGTGKVVAVMPAYNEEEHIGEVVARVKDYVDEIIVVDDCSADRTGEIARKAGARVLRHPANKGLGASLRDGIAEALRRGADVIITIDSDGQHRPEDIPKLLGKIAEGRDFVLGERDMSRYPLIKRIGNFLLTVLTDIVSGTTLRDTESGFRAFTAEAARKMRLGAERYEIAAEFILEVGLRGLTYANVRVASPLYHRGKGVSVADGFRNFLYLLRRRKASRGWGKAFLIVMKKWVKKLADWVGMGYDGLFV